MDDQNERLTILMEQYGTSVLHLVYSLVRNRQTAEDLTQEIFIKCFKQLHTFKGNADVKTWIYRISVNHCKDYFRSWNYRKIHVSDYISTLLKGKTNGPDLEYQQKEEKSRLMEEILKLPNNYKEIILLFYFHDLSLKEISEVCDININTAKTRLSRAKEMLKNSIIERIEHDGESV